MLNHELEIINRIRNTFAHELDPLINKIPDLVKKFKLYAETKTSKNNNQFNQVTQDGFVLGSITGVLMRYLAEKLWEINSRSND